MPRLTGSITSIFLLLAGRLHGEEKDQAPLEVEVRGAQLSPGEARKDPAVAGSTRSREELEPPGLAAPDALRTMVGVTVTETGGLGAAATAHVRGATAAQTPVYLAGVRINDDVGGAADLASVPLFLVDRIEVYRGNAPLEADRLGIGGAIFFEPIRPREPRVGVGAMGGSFGTRGAWAYSATSTRHGSLLFGARVEAADNDYAFHDDNGTLLVTSDDRRRRLTNAEATLIDLWAIGRGAVGSGHVGLVMNRFEREQGAPGLASVATHQARQGQARTLVSVSGTAPLPSAVLGVRTTLLSGRSTILDPLFAPPDNPGELGLGSARLTSRGERVEEELSLRLPFGDVHALRAVAAASHERLRRNEGVGPGDGEPVLSERRVTARAAAAGVIAASRKLSLRPLATIECHSTGTTARTCDTIEPSGRLSALLDLGEIDVFSAVGRYVRVPTLAELFGTSLVVRGQPTLRSEAGVTLDAGARFTQPLAGQASPAYVSLGGYARSVKDLVTFVRTAQDYVVPVNLGRARVTGLELEAGAGFARFFSADFALTALDARDLTPGRRLVNDIVPYQSRLVLAPGLRARSPRLGTFAVERATLGARLVHQSSRYADPAGQAVIPEQTSVDLDAAVEGLGGLAVLRGRVADVFDQPRFDVVGFPLPGRSVFVSLELRNGMNRE